MEAPKDLPGPGCAWLMIVLAVIGVVSLGYLIYAGIGWLFNHIHIA